MYFFDNKYIHDLKILQLFLKIFLITIKEDILRIWILNSTQTRKTFNKHIKDATYASKTYDYKMFLDGRFVEPEDDKTFDDLDILPEDFVVLEVRESNKNWIFHNV